MPLILFIVVGLVGAVIYLLRLVTRLQDRVDSLERHLDEVSYNLNKLVPGPLPAAQTAQPAPAVTRTESMQSSPTLPRSIEMPITSKPGPSPIPATRSAPPVFAKIPVTTPQTTPVPPPLPPAKKAEINWEQFLGAKLFAWIGGLALFVGIAFFVKYSFDRDLIPPWLRVALGFAVGVGLILGGVMTRRKEYLITAQTLVATGVVVLYGVSFIARSLYHLINTPVLFVLMTGITVAAFTLAIRMEARVVAVLGMLGGFLTPQLVPVTRDQPFALFSYVIMLNLGLLAVARQRNWSFLIPLAACATVFTEGVWILSKLRPENVFGTILMICAITVLFTANARYNLDPPEGQPRSLFAGALQGLIVLLLVWMLIIQRGLGVQAPMLLATLFFGNAALLSLYALAQKPLPLILAVSGVGVLLAMWTRTGPQLLPACIATLLYAAFNALLPAWIARWRETPQTWPNIASVAGLGLLLLMLFRDADPGWLFWPTVLGVNAVLLGVAFLRGSLWLALCGTLGTALISMYWILHLDNDAALVPPLAILSVFALIYFFFGGVLSRKQDDPTALYFPAIPAAVPFLLMALLLLRLEIATPTLLFTFAAGLNLLLIFASPARSTSFALVGLVGTFLLEFLWFAKAQTVSNAMTNMAWHIGFSLGFTFWPLLKKQDGDWLRWYVSAAAGPVHFFLIYGAAKLAWPEMAAPGIIPILFGLPALAMLLTTRKSAPNAEAILRFTAIYGASLSFFVTLIFPIQFDRQWLTIGWVLEGVALLWLNRRAPAQWLVGLGTVLLAIAFSRLALNLSVFQYQQRGTIPLLNWYLYAYGLVAMALFVAARLSNGIPNGRQLKALFSSMGTLLLFLLMNIEIADFFADGPYLTFDFSANFGRDMTYSIAWSLFALALLIVGVKRDVAPVRYAGIALMGTTLLKLFFHDLTRLDALFRIGAFIGVAVILIFASWMYQRFLFTSRKPGEVNPSA